MVVGIYKKFNCWPGFSIFIWLSFTSTSSNTLTANTAATNIDFKDGSSQVEQVKQNTGDLMTKFIIGIGMLIGGMTVAQSIGGAVASAALNKGKGFAMAALDGQQVIILLRGVLVIGEMNQRKRFKNFRFSL